MGFEGISVKILAFAILASANASPPTFQGGAFQFLKSDLYNYEFINYDL